MKPQILYGMPIIATKDHNWIQNGLKNCKFEPGAVWLLPEDAILIMAPATEASND